MLLPTNALNPLPLLFWLLRLLVANAGVLGAIGEGASEL
jgi:hypothetical protein